MKARRRHRVELAGAGLLLAMSLSLGCGKSVSGGAENVVLIVADTLRADHLSIYGGSVSTPHLDALGASGARFERAYSHVPVTGPSHTSLFTGQLPTDHGIQVNAAVVPSDLETLAERLREQGYHTAGFISLGVLNSKYGFAQGFDDFDESLSDNYFRRGDQVTQAALDWLDQPPRQPFFLWLHYSDPHEPYSPPTETYPQVEVWLDSRHQQTVSANGYRHTLDLEVPPGNHILLLAAPRGGGIERHQLAFRQIRLRSDAVSIAPGSGWLTTGVEETRGGSRLNGVSALPAEIRLMNPGDRKVDATLSFFCHEDLTEQRLRELYALETAYLDRQIGRVLRHLEDSGLRGDTVVVFTSDHGEGLGDHNLEGHIQQLYDSLLRVPLFLSAPGVTRPDTILHDPVRLIDVPPTILELLGLPPLPGSRGESLLPLLSGSESDAPRPVVGSTFRPLARFDQRSLIRFPFKYILNLQTTQEELYDLERDPQEFSNLIESRPQLAAEMRFALHQELETEARSGKESPTLPELSQEEIDKLEALGYVE